MKTEPITRITRLLVAVFALLLNICTVIGQELPAIHDKGSNKNYRDPAPDRVEPPLIINHSKSVAAPVGSIAVNENALYNTYTPAQLVQDVLISGCITVSNVTFNRTLSANVNQRQLGYFNQAGSLFPMNEGLVLSSGYVTSSEGPNNSPNSSNALGLTGDPDLDLLAGASSLDAAVLEFDFIPNGDLLEFKYIFSSEEYLEYCCSAFNDAFGFFLSGPGIAGPYSLGAENIALLPSTTIPVTINNVHAFVASNHYGNPCPAQNAGYYIDNPNGTLTTQFDGMTVILTATYPVTRCSTYHIKMAVGDVSDDKLNSAVFLQARSFSSSPPVVTCPNDTTIQCGTSTLPSSTGIPDITNNCVIVNVTYDDLITVRTCTGDITITRTWSVTDACMNTATCEQIISVIDNLSPWWVDLPGSLDRTVECDDLASALALFPTAADLCATAALGPPASVITPGICPGEYTITRTWALEDDCGNTGADFVQIITVEDNTAPTWDQAPGALDLTISCDDPAAVGAALALFPTATDNCSTVIITGPVVVNTPGSCASNYTITRTWSLADNCGNIGPDFIQTITVQDIVAPVLIGAPANITLQCDDAIPAPGLVTATDNCGPNPLVTMTEITTGGSCPDSYTITRTWKATDLCNNVGTATQVITITDNTPPVIVTCAIPQSANADALCQAAVPDFLPLVVATDNCSPVNAIVITQLPAAGTIVGIGVTVITITVTDLCGNFATCTTTFTVNPEPSPVITTQPVDQDICPGANASFSVTAAGTGTLFYQWQVNTGSGWTNILNGGVYTGANASTLNLTSPPFGMNGYQYRCIVNTCSQQAISNTAILNIYPVLNNGSATANQTICYNSIPATINATQPSGGGGTYTYQWQFSTDNITFFDISGATSLSYSPVALILTTYYRMNQTSGSGCGMVTTNVVTITVNPVLIPGVASADQTICYNAVPSVITATLPSGGNGSYTYQWQASTDNITYNNIAGATSLTYSPAALMQTTYYRMNQASGGGCGTVTTNVVTITVNPELIPGISATDQTICFNSIPAPLAATAPTGGDGIYSYQWQVSTNNITFNNIPGANSLSYAPGSLSVTTYFRLRQTSGSGCGTDMTNVVTITIIPDLFPGIASANQVICSNFTPAALNATLPTGGDGVYTYQWQVSNDNISFNDIPGATSLSYSPGALTQTTYYRQNQSSGSGCGMVITNVVTITVNPDLVAGTASADQALCYNSIPAPLTATAPSGGNGSFTYQWQVSTDNITFNIIPGATALLYSPAALTQTTWYRLSQTSGGGCGTVITNVVTITVNPILLPGFASADQAICINTLPAPLTATPPTGGSGSYTYQWQDSNDNISFNNIAGANGLSFAPGALSITTYFRLRQTSGSGCGIVTTNVVIISINPIPSVAGLTIPVCSDAPAGVIFSPGISIPAVSYDIININSNGLTAFAGNPVTGNGFAANEIADDAWTNPTTAALDVIYTVIPLSADGCPGNAYIVTLQVQSEPIVAGQMQTICSDMPSGVLLNASTTVAVSGYNITNISSGSLTASAGSPSTGIGFSANAIADDAWTNTGNAPANVIYAIVPIAASGCAGNPFKVTLTINPEPVVADQMNDFACSGLTTGIILGPGTNITPVTYNIISINSNGLIAIGGNPATGTGFTENEIADDAWSNATSGAANVIYTIVPVSNLGCNGNAFTVTIQVHPDPVTDFTSNTSCQGDSTIFTVTGQFINSISLWQWDFGDGTSWMCNSPGCATEPHVFPFNGTYPVTLHVTDTNGCEYEVTHIITVLPRPVAFFSFDTPDCLGSAIQFTDLSKSPGDPAYTFIRQWEWDFGDGTPTQTVVFPADPNMKHIYANTGTFLVTLTITNSHGCTDIFSTEIKITNIPIPDFTHDPVCEDAAAAFQDISLENGGGEIIGWAWDFGDPASGINNSSDLQNPTHIFATPGNFVVTFVVINFNGCSDTLQKVVTVKAAPDASFSSTPGCVGSATEFSANLALTNPGSIASYLWNFGDGLTANSPVAAHNYSAPGIYIVSLTITDTAGCEGIHSDTISVNNPPLAQFSVNTVNCISEAVLFSDHSTTGAGYFSSWTWDFGDGNIQIITHPAIPDTQHNYLLPGTYNVTLTVETSEGCTDQEQILVTIIPGPVAGFTYEGDCGSDAVTFTDISSIVGNTSITGWSWNFGDATSGVNNTSNIQNPSHTFSTDGTYLVSLVITTANACNDTITQNLQIRPLPPVDFETQGVCQDNPVQFSPDAGLMNLNTIASYLWDFGDGQTSTSQNVQHIYTIAGPYSIKLSVTDTSGCTNSITHLLQIKDLPIANFNFSAPSCEQSMVQFEDLTTVENGFIVNRKWDFGDGTSQVIHFPDIPNVNHAYANTGTYDVTLTVTTNDSCTNLVTKTISVLTKPVAAFSHGSGCEDIAISFTDLSVGSGGFVITQWEWNFGEPTSGTSNTSSIRYPSHYYNTSGTYTVTLIVSNVNGCSDTITHQVTVTAPPVVNFSSLAACSGSLTQFTSSAFVNMANTQSWQWQFGDGGSSTTADPGHIYIQPGTFTVTLTITDISGCTNTITNQVIIPAGAYANFSSNAPGCANAQITFNDLSNGNGNIISSWHMDFGDSTDTTFSYAPGSVTHTYANPGNFIVTLTVNTPLGCPAIVQHATTVSSSPVSAFSYSASCGTAYFTDQSTLDGGAGIVGWQWNFGDPASGTSNTSTLKNPTHIYTAPGNFLVTLEATNAAGCAGSSQSPINVPGIPSVGILTDNVTCQGQPATFFTDTIITNVASIQSYNWNFGDGTANSSSQNPVHTFTTSGTYTITLTVTDFSGCQNSISQELNFHELPTAAFSYSSSCGNSNTNFTDHSIAPYGETITGWSWNFGDQTSVNNSSNLKNPVHIYINAGTYNVTQTVFTANGCSKSITLTVKIWENPTAHFNYIVSPCSNGEVQFQDATNTYQSIITDWQWEFEPNQFASGQNPTHQFFYTDSCYSVRLIVTNNRGCVDTTIQQVCIPAPLAITFNLDQSCYGTQMLFTPQLDMPGGQSLQVFNWNFGDPLSGSNNTSSLMNPGHMFSAPGFYTIYLTSTDQYGCRATTSQTVEVKTLPTASFTYVPGQCDNTIHFTSTSTDPYSQITSFIWNYGDGITETFSAPNNTVSHQYAAPGIYDVTLTVVNLNSCEDNKTITIERDACLVAAFMQSDTLACQNYTIAFTEMSTCDGTITQWQWNWGDNSQPTVYNAFKPSVSHTFSEAGTFNVTLEITTTVAGTAKTDIKSLLVRVMASPTARFVPEDVCLGGTTTFRNTTYANGADVLYYNWNFGDMSVVADSSDLENPVYQYKASGAYDASLVVTNGTGCADTINHIVKVNGLPSAVFSYDQLCPGYPTLFTSQDDPSMPAITSWNWMISEGQSGNGMAGAVSTYTFSKEGTYIVQLAVTDSNSCVDTTSLEVIVNPGPVSAFSIVENYENEQGRLQLSNGSVDATNYSWDFGNGNTSTTESPVVIYPESGTYTISLIASNKFGCFDTISMNYEFLVKGLYIPNAFSPGSGENGVRLFKPVGVNLQRYSIEVYDTFGNLVWTSTLLDESGAPVEGWDGTYKGRMCQQDVYVWKVFRAIFRDGTIWHNNDIGEHGTLDGGDTYGTVTLIR